MTALCGRSRLDAVAFVLGALIVLGIAYEVAARVLLSLVGRIRVGTIDLRTHSEIFIDEPWAEEYFREFHDSSELRWHPYLYWRRKRFAGRFINVDSDGKRSTWRVPLAERRGRPVEIAIFGGSTMWGTGVRDENTIASQIARELWHVDGIHARVTNHAETGYVSTQNVIALMREIQAAARPDLVVFVDGTNDVWSAYQQGVTGIPQNEFNREREFNLLLPQHRLVLLRYLVDPTRYADLAGIRLAAVLRRRLLRSLSLTRRTETLREPNPILIEQVVDIYRRNVEIVKALAASIGTETLFYWQPLVYTKRQPSSYERMKAHEAPYGAATAHFRAAHERVRCDPFLMQEARFHDLSDVFGDQETGYFLDISHLSERGQKLLAERMLDDIRPLVRSILVRRAAAASALSD